MRRTFGSHERAPAVAGAFYPASPNELDRMVDGLLREAPEEPLRGELRGLIVPHAGYIYSGGVAATAFRHLRRREFDTIVLLGPSHRYRFDGAALHAKGTFETPLGRVPVDEAFCAELLASDPVFQDQPEAHAPEHDLEVQLPFLQKVLPTFAIVPIIQYDFSEANCRRIAEALSKALKGKNALLVVTTDLAHYPSYEHAVESDRAMIEAIESLDPNEIRTRSADYLSRSIRNLHVTMCGTGPVIAGIETAKALGATGFQTLRYANSGDVPGTPRDQVVGYVGGALIENGDADADAIEREEPMGRERIEIEPSSRNADFLDEATQRALLRLARETIARYLEGDPLPSVESYGFPPAVVGTLRETRRGAFVTLKGGGALRGCIGHIADDLPLAEVVPRMAIAAATEDPRFPRVARDELDLLEIEISVLTPPHLVDDLESIEVGRHGLIARKGLRSGLLLPQVPVEQGWNRRQFLAYTCLKAGLHPKAWEDAGTQIYAFEAQVFSEADFEDVKR